MGQQIDEDRIELDPGDVTETKQVCRKQVTAAAYPDDRGPAAIADRVGEVRNIEAEEVDLRQIALKSVHRSAGAAVDRHPVLRYHNGRQFRRWPPQIRRVDGLQRDPHPREGIPLLRRWWLQL